MIAISDDGGVLEDMFILYMIDEIIKKEKKKIQVSQMLRNKPSIYTHLACIYNRWTKLAAIFRCIISIR